MPDPLADSRVVVTLDAGGTSFRFSAARGGIPVFINNDGGLFTYGEAVALGAYAMNQLGQAGFDRR